MLVKYKCRLNIIFAEHDIKKGEFANLINRNPGTLSSIVNSKSLPDFETTYSILEKLGECTDRGEMYRLEEVWVKMN